MEWVEVAFEVPGGRPGGRVDAYLVSRLRGYSRARVQRLIAEGRVSARGVAVKPSSRVAAGDRILVRYPRRPEPPARYGALPVLFEDEDLLAVAKPGDLLSHPTDRVVADSAVAVLKLQKPGSALRLAHRLDRETSGVLLFAKSAAAARSLAVQFSGRRVRKEYLALVSGRVGLRSIVVDRPVGREGLGIKVRQKVAEEGGAAAATEFFLEASAERASLLRAVPRTGRLHQIRVHLAWLGHPVLGDKLYSGDGECYMKAVRRELTPEDIERLGAPRQMLHAWRLELAHPGTGRRLALEAPPPGDFLGCAGSLGLSAAWARLEARCS